MIYGITCGVAGRNSILSVLSNADGRAAGRYLLGAVGGVVKADATDVFVKVNGDVDGVRRWDSGIVGDEGTA